MDLSIIKDDVIQKLTSKEYYNQQEILRLVNVTNEMSHADRVAAVCDILNENVLIRESIKLMGFYFPVKETQSPESSENPNK